MRDFAKLTNAYCQVEGAAEMLRDLLSEGNADRLALAMQDACMADREEMERTLRFLDWLLADGEDHLDGMLAEIYGIDPEAILNERRLRAKAMQSPAARERALAHHQRRAVALAKIKSDITRARLPEVKTQAVQLQGPVALRRVG